MLPRMPDLYCCNRISKSMLDNKPIPERRGKESVRAANQKSPGPQSSAAADTAPSCPLSNESFSVSSPEIRTNSNQIPEPPMSRSERLADATQSFLGSKRYVQMLSVVLIGWTGVTLSLLPKGAIDTSWMFLNLVVSAVSAFTAPMLIMSERCGWRAKQRVFANLTERGEKKLAYVKSISAKCNVDVSDLEPIHEINPSPSRFVRCSLQVQKAMGSFWFLSGEVGLIAGWIATNGLGVDVMPYPVLNLVLSIQAGLAATFVFGPLPWQCAEELSCYRRLKRNCLAANAMFRRICNRLYNKVETSPEMLSYDDEPVSPPTKMERFINWLGTPASLIVHFGGFSSWMIANALCAHPVDPYPFLFLNLLCSYEGFMVVPATACFNKSHHTKRMKILQSAILELNKELLYDYQQENQAVDSNKQAAAPISQIMKDLEQILENAARLKAEIARIRASNSELGDFNGRIDVEVEELTLQLKRIVLEVKRNQQKGDLK